MLFSDIPVKFQIPFASSAPGGDITYPMPVVPGAPGRANLTEGFPDLTFQPLGSGGNPPYGKDFNGLLKQITAWLWWAQAGGVPLVFDSAFSTANGGYPNHALLQSTTAGHYWISKVDNNATDPDSVGASNWEAFPDKLIQQQAGNVATDAGAANVITITLNPVPASWASIAGAPLRWFVANATTVNNPTLGIVGVSGLKTLVNTDGTALAIGQISRAGQFCEGFYDLANDVVQLASPAKTVAGARGVPVGAIFWFPVETPPTGFLFCDGSTVLIVNFPNLFNVIGTTYGGNGTSTFVLPDLRGRFVRGWSDGVALDPDRASRTANHVGGATGDHVGTLQGWAIGQISAQLANPVINWALGNTMQLGTQSLYWPAGSLPLGVDLQMIGWTAGATITASVNYIASGEWTAPPPPPVNSNFPTSWQRNTSASFLIPTAAESGSGVFSGVLASSLTGTLIGNSTETRSVNIYMMPVIAY